MRHHPSHLPPITTYYQARAADAVVWRPWGEKALREAAAKKKPIFLNIGYAACSWCQRMASEAFRNPAIAAYLNRYFIPITVDRHQRPDVAAAYQMPVVAMTGKTGWPLNVFLIPQGGPYHGGTYFPPVEGALGMPSFQDVLIEAAQAWQNDRQRVEDIAAEMARQMGEGLRPLFQTNLPYPTDPTGEALAALEPDFDAQYGGFESGPKFPQALLLQWLLTRAHHGDNRARQMALTTLIGMARGGIYDLLGGGFHLYAEDRRWRQPRFEKPLALNALLARAYTAAYRLTGQAAFRRVAESTLDFILSTLTLPNGLLASAQSGENPHDEGEGRFFTWTADEVRAILPAPQADLLIAAYDLADEPRTLQRALTEQTLSERFALTLQETTRQLEAARQSLRAARAHRFPPPIDATVITSWNALAVLALAEAGAALQAPRYTQAAVRVATALRQHLHDGHSLSRGQHEDQPIAAGFLEDYAATALAYLTLHRVQAPPPAPAATETANSPWLYESLALLEALQNRFAADWGYYDTLPSEHFFPFGRPQEILDGATPCGNALTATLLAELTVLTGENAFQTQTGTLLDRMAPLLARHPTAFPQWLLAWEILHPPTP